MNTQTYILLGAPVDSGKRRRGCLMGPAAFRTADLAEALRDLGHAVQDHGDVTPARPRDVSGPAHVYALAETVAWTEALSAAAESTMSKGLPIFLGGDHSLSLGTVAGVAAHAASVNRPLFVLWLDAHSDLHHPPLSNQAIFMECEWAMSPVAPDLRLFQS